MVTIFEYCREEGLSEMGTYGVDDAVEGLRHYLEEIGFPDIDIDAMLMGVDLTHGDRHARLEMGEFQIVAEFNEVLAEDVLGA